MSHIEDRIAQLEREVGALRTTNRRTKALLGLALLGAALPFLLASSGQQVLKADKFQVTKGDKVVAELSSDDLGGLLTINDNAGSAMMFLSGDEEGAQLEAYSKGGNLAAWLFCDKDGRGAFEVENEDEATIAWMGAISDGSGHISVGNKAGDRVGWLATDTAGGGFMKLFNAKKAQTAWLATDSSGGGQLNLYNPSNQRVVYLGETTSGLGQVSVANSSGTEVAKLLADTAMQGQLSILNKNGTEVAYLVSDTDGRGQISVRDINGSELGMYAGSPAGGFVTLRAPNGTVRWSAP